MAAVYATHRAGGEPAAIKILHWDYTQVPSLRQRFLREATLLRAVRHEGCVQVLESGVTEGGEPYFVMELLEGCSLREVLDQTSPLPLCTALGVAEQVLDCLAACHDEGIIHRDLKPANVFLTTTGGVKLLDFGIARKREPGINPTQAGLVLGTPGYFAPEQAAGRSDVDCRADVFGVGALLRVMLSGKRLHGGKSWREAAEEAATQPPPPIASILPTLPTRVSELVDRATAWDRKDRFQDARQMKEAVQGVLACLDSSPTLPQVHMNISASALTESTELAHSPLSPAGLPLSSREGRPRHKIRELSEEHLARLLSGEYRLGPGQVHEEHPLIHPLVGRACGPACTGRPRQEDPVNHALWAHRPPPRAPEGHRSSPGARFSDSPGFYSIQPTGRALRDRGVPVRYRASRRGH